MKEKKKKVTGRPSIFTQVTANEICKRISNNESLRSICRDEKMPSLATVINWLLDTKYSEFLVQYRVARDIQAEHMFEEVREIAEKAIADIEGDDKSDGARVQARKLEVDTLKWILSRMNPKKYSDKIDVTSEGKALKGNTITFTNFAS